MSTRIAFDSEEALLVPSFGFTGDDPLIQYLGGVHTIEKRCLVFPNGRF